MIQEFRKPFLKNLVALRARDFYYPQPYLLKQIPYIKFKVIIRLFWIGYILSIKDYLKHKTKRDEFVEYDRSYTIGESFEQGELDCARKISNQFKVKLGLFNVGK